MGFHTPRLAKRRHRLAEAVARQPWLLIDAAKADGYTKMRLDTADRLTEAIAMYASMGFGPISPYRQYPEQLRPYLVFMERAL